MSAGMQQRVAIARALGSPPTLLLVDFATTIDPRFVELRGRVAQLGGGTGGPDAEPQST